MKYYWGSNITVKPASELRLTGRAEHYCTEMLYTSRCNQHYNIWKVIIILQENEQMQ